MTTPVIQVQNLWKSYGLPISHHVRRALGWKAQRTWSLQDLNFELHPGETLGLIGHNGAGKSTLLKVLAGVTPPTRGHVQVRGSLFPMIELNAGMNPELTGRENIFLLGAIMGLSPAEIRRQMPAMEDFCELGAWFDSPVWQYSSGMLARLGFAVALHVEADILLVDEVLAVGDITFQRKSLDRMERMQQSGKAVIFVSHSIRQIERLCTRVMLLEQGQVVAVGSPVEVISQYYDSTNTRILEHYTESGERVLVLQETITGQPIEIQQITTLNGAGMPQQTFKTGETLLIEVHYTSQEIVEDAIFGISILTVDSLFLTGLPSASGEIPVWEAGVVRCHIPRLPLLTGVYVIQCKIMRSTGAALGGGRGLMMFSVTAPEEIAQETGSGLVHLPSEWESAPVSAP